GRRHVVVEGCDIAAYAGGGDRAEVHDGVDAVMTITDGGECVDDLPVIGEIDLHEVRAAGAHDVHADHVPAVRAQFTRDDRAELAGGAGEGDAHEGSAFRRGLVCNVIG